MAEMIPNASTTSPMGDVQTINPGLPNGRGKVVVYTRSWELAFPLFAILR
jgi:hypothetical protein